MQLFTPVDCVACCICHCSAYFYIPNVSQTSFIAAWTASRVRVASLLIFSTCHENELNQFQPISIRESIACRLYPVGNHYIFSCKSLTSHNTIRVRFSQTFPPSRLSSEGGYGYTQARQVEGFCISYFSPPLPSCGSLADRLLQLSFVLVLL